MFRSNDTSTLRAEIDRFNVPIFIADLTEDGANFRFRALNAAHEAQSGMNMETVAGRRIDEVLPSDQASVVNERYATCVSRLPQLRYREKLRMPHGEMIWDTTLHHIITHEGADRVVGSAVVVEYVRRDKYDTLAFEDVRFFATCSEFKLGQITSVLEAMEKGAIPAESLAGSATVLAGMCRAIDTTMQELRSIAEGRLSADLNPSKPLIESGSGASQLSQTSVESAMAALIEAAGNLPDAPGHHGVADRPCELRRSSR